jgi:ABC-type methionine transport system ATPase subunit
MKMSDQIIRLTYPSALLKVPVINQLIRHYDVTVNILKAQIDTHQGWIEVQLAGNTVVIEEAVGWLKAQGVNVEQIDES